MNLNTYWMQINDLNLNHENPKKKSLYNQIYNELQGFDRILFKILDLFQQM